MVQSDLENWFNQFTKKKKRVQKNDLFTNWTSLVTTAVEKSNAIPKCSLFVVVTNKKLSDVLMFCLCVFAHLLKNRFAKVEDQKDALRLYTIQIPHKRERKPPQCYITKWDGRAFLPLLTKPCGNEVISCLAVR